MSLILKNTTLAIVGWGGEPLAGSSQRDIQFVEQSRLLIDDEFLTALSLGEAVVNNSFYDLGPPQALLILRDSIITTSLVWSDIGPVSRGSYLLFNKTEETEAIPTIRGRIAFLSVRTSIFSNFEVEIVVNGALEHVYEVLSGTENVEENLAIIVVESDVVEVRINASGSTKAYDPIVTLIGEI